MYAVVARRTDLDAALLDVARASGVKVCDGHGLVGLEGPVADDRSDSIALDVEGLGTVRARYAIGADGIWSRLRKALDADRGDGYLGDWHAFRQYFSRVGPDAAAGLWVWFEPDLLPGYAWSFPLPGGRANVGFGVPRRPGRRSGELAGAWGELLARPHIRAVLGDGARAEGPHRTWPIPAQTTPPPLFAAGGRALFVGDAARVGDPMTGEGIAQALETGSLAAEAILRAGPYRAAEAAGAYEDAVRRSLGTDNRLAGLLSRLLGRPRRARAALRLAGASPWTRQNFARWLFEDYPRAVLLTPGRWHRHVLAGPGAYR
jgi:flavin-dependent dehydrogenase